MYTYVICILYVYICVCVYILVRGLWGHTPILYWHLWKPMCHRHMSHEVRLSLCTCTALCNAVFAAQDACPSSGPMFSRASQPSSSSSALPQQEFQDDVLDLFADNLVSGQRVARLLKKASKAGVEGISSRLQATSSKNSARSTRRHKLKRTKWPAYYYFDCRLKDRRRDEEYTSSIPINLPLELLEMLWELGRKDVLLSTDNLDTDGKKHMAWMKEQLQVDELWGWGLHGDGIPCNYDRTESVIMISLNLPGLKGKNGRMRIPLVILPDQAVSENTFDDIFTVIAWSMRHLVTGTRPCCRHDGTAWGPRDHKRKKKNNVPLPFRACLVQVRADWDWMGKCFHLPFHSVKEGCCWLCSCKRNQVRPFS